MRKLFLVLIVFVLVVFLSFQTYLDYQFYKNISIVEKYIVSQSAVQDKNVTPGEINTDRLSGTVCGKECDEQIEKKVLESIKKLPTPTGYVIKQPSSTIAKRVGYVPMGQTSTTSNTDWVDVSDSGTLIDLENDYGKNAVVTWEASLLVAHGNGEAFARIYDKTNNIAVDFSEISTVNNSTFKQAFSPNLPFWRGKNLYIVQIRSLNSIPITYSSGKLKVVY